jgi:translocation and assembly module TamA
MKTPGLALLSVVLAMQASAATLSVQIDGVEGELKEAALAASDLAPYVDREVTAAQARRLFARAPLQISAAFEAYGFYHATAKGDLKETPKGLAIALHVEPGEPTGVATLDLVVPEPARDEKPVRKALATFAPKQGERFHHGLYEKSKAAVQAALLASGYLDSKLVTHTVEVSRTENRATIRLEWDPGTRYRYGPTTFSGGQFAEGFLDRYVPWHEGDFYDQAQVLQLQQKLIDADFFAVVEVQPDSEHAGNGVVPIAVSLGPAKRDVYSAGVFVDTDVGFGVRGGWTRRWLNGSGHRVRVDAQLAQRLRSATATYSIPLPGENNRSFNFGAGYLYENTDTTQSNNRSLAANETRQWMGFTRTLGLRLLDGTFTILDPHGNEAIEEHGSSTLLYPEIVLERKRADDPLFVHDGYSILFALRGSLDQWSSTQFVQARADGKWIHAFGSNQRVILRGSVGAMKVGDFDQLPPDLRFFAGGDRSIRGFAYQTIGPQNENGLIIGGEDLLVGSAEYEYYFTHDWGMAAFVDAGDAYTGFANFRTRIGSGLGLRWRSPVGMVRADIGVPVRDPDGHTGVELHLVIGPDL